MRTPPRTFASCILLLSALALQSTGCATSPEAKAARQSRRNVAKLQGRLEELSEHVKGPGLYHDHDVRESIDSMPRSLVEEMIPDAGYMDVNKSRANPLTCKVADMYGQMNECARSFVNFLRAYRSSWGKGSSDFSSPEWAQVGDKITVVFDSRFYELVFDAELELSAVKYRADEEQ